MQVLFCKTTLAPFWLVAYLIFAAGLLTGCQPSADTRSQVNQTEAPQASSVPLEILIASNAEGLELIERRWQADSDQPLSIKQISIDELTSDNPPNADVILFQSRYLLDLIQQKVIYKLSDAAFVGADDQMIPLSEAEVSQVRYRGQRFAMPLGCTLPTLVANDKYPDASGMLSMDEILAELDLTGGLTEVDRDVLNSDALVDRFLYLAGSFSDRNPKFGLLFEMQSMHPRLSRPEYVAAANGLKALTKQKDGSASVYASHSYAWRWATQGESARVAVSIPTLLDRDAEAVSTGKLIKLKPQQGSGGWNTGGGIVAAIAATCRQSSQSIEFIRWLRRAANRDAIAPLIVGVQSDTPTQGAEQLSWLARQEQIESLNTFGLSKEPSLPKAGQYRKLLAGELVSILEGKKTTEEGLRDASEAWKKIHATQQGDLRSEYEQSLGLQN